MNGREARVPEALERCLERRALDELHAHEAAATIVEAELVDRHDTGMLELPCNLGLLGEASYLRSVGR